MEILESMIAIATVICVLMIFPFQWKRKKEARLRNAEIRVKLAENGSEAVREGSADVIVVGAGVAGAALACALGKVSLGNF